MPSPKQTLKHLCLGSLERVVCDLMVGVAQKSAARNTVRFCGKMKRSDHHKRRAVLRGGALLAFIVLVC
jgi:hypothetical protein